MRARRRNPDQQLTFDNFMTESALIYSNDKNKCSLTHKVKAICYYISFDIELTKELFDKTMNCVDGFFINCTR
jgi:hypothetical protein